MSRINDALKQARQAQQNQPPAGVPPLTPAATKTPRGVGWILPATVILLLIAACLFIGLALFKRPAAPVTGQPDIAATPTNPVEPATVVAVITQTNKTPATNVATVTAPPQLKLQGIFADPKRPCAIVSGKTVFVGDLVDDFRVTKISQKTITLKKSDGTEKKLTLAK